MKRSEVQSLYDEGTAKDTLFTKMLESGSTEKSAANLLATLKDKTLCALNETKNNALITIMFLQTCLIVFNTYAMAVQNGMSPVGPAIATAIIPALLIYGFSRFNAIAYQAYIFLAIIGMPQELVALTKGSFEAIIGLPISIALLIFVWFLKSKLFPDLGLINAKKVDGKYIFLTRQGEN